MTFAVELNRLRDGDDIATMIGCPPELFRAVVAGVESFFVEHQIPKRKRARGFRHVVEVTDEALLDSYRHLADRFHDALAHELGSFPHPAAHGYVQKRSIRTNALAHMPCTYLLKADIADFFNTITIDRVSRLMLELKMQPDAARALARFTTFHGVLPLGFPSSPSIANAVCLELDEGLVALANKHGCKYTRYADDLTFSNKTDDLPERIEVESILGVHGFRLSADKFFKKKRGQAFYITGLSVSEDKAPRAPRLLKQRLRQELHYAKKGVREHLGRRGYSSFQSGVNQISGSIRYLHSIEPDLARKFQAIWEEALAKDGLSAVQQARPGAEPRQVTLYFDESVVKNETTGKRTMLLGCALTEDADHIRPILVQLAQNELADAYGMSKKGPLAKHGLHWKELNHPTRDALAQSIASFPVRSYVAFAELVGDADYQNMYLELLSRVMSRRLIALDGRVVTLVFENNQQVKSKEITATVDSLLKKQAEKNGRRPLKIDVQERTKQDEPCLALADALLGLVGDFALDNTDVARKRFERVRGKFRIVEDVDGGVAHTRRNAFPRLGLIT